jgi:hypothetical protein
MADPFKLTPEEVVALRGNIPKLNQAQETIERLKRIGIDVTEQEERLAIARRVNQGMLTEFSPTGRRQQ